MTTVNQLNARLIQLERERDTLRAENVKLRNKLLEVAKECSGCEGTGVVTVMREPDSHLYSGVLISREEPCGDCLDIREALL